MQSKSKHKSTKFVLAAVLNVNLFIALFIPKACLGGFLNGYIGSIFNPCMDNIAYFNKWDNDPQRAYYEGIITAIVPAGAMIGAFAAGEFLLIGRRKAMIVVDFIQILGVLITLIPGLNALLYGRLLCGFCMGLNSVLMPIYINEISPIEISGICGSMYQFMSCLGLLLAFFTGFLLPPKYELIIGIGLNDWKILFGFPIVLNLLRILLFATCFSFETPLFLYSTNQLFEAEQVLEQIYRPEFIKEKLNDLKAVCEKSQGKSISFKDLWSPRFKRQFTLGLSVQVIMCITGINAVLYYSNKIFEETLNEFMANMFSFSIGLILTVTALISGGILDNYGRRPLMLAGHALCILTLGMLSTFKLVNLVYLNNFVILVFVFGFGMSLGPITPIYTSEILPDKGVSYSMLTGWFGTCVVGFAFPKMINSCLEMEGTFFVFCVLSIIGFLYFYYFLKETQGKTPEEIQKMFSQSSQSKYLAKDPFI